MISQQIFDDWKSSSNQFQSISTTAPIKPKKKMSLFALMAEGEKIKEYGFSDGTILFFDADTPYVDGRISCFRSRRKNARTKYKISRGQVEGFFYVGALVASVRSFDERMSIE